MKNVKYKNNPSCCLLTCDDGTDAQPIATPCSQFGGLGRTGNVALRYQLN